MEDKKFSEREILLFIQEKQPTKSEFKMRFSWKDLFPLYPLFLKKYVRVLQHEGMSAYATLTKKGEEALGKLF